MVWMRPEKGSDAVLEVFSVLPEDEVERVMAKKLKRAKKKARRLTVKHMSTLQLDEDRLLAVSLLDCTVKVFYTDTLKFFSLCGHKLPVPCLDISHDSALIATGSADRNIKIWAGKDKKIEQWDADKFEHIQTLEVTFTPMLLHFPYSDEA
ncbi:unnamed protein product [Coregonus sp. 'balchen']|nr:unnamed protein product [Coregonus sp. 'balchen']